MPDNAIVNVGLEAFEAIVMLPLAAAAVEGANVTLKLALCPAAKVKGAAMPLNVNPVPVTLTCEIVTLEPPVLVIVSGSDWLLPTVTLPKLSVVGFAPKLPGVTPVPVSGIVRVGLEALEVSETFPAALPADVGLNETVKVAL